MRQMYSKFAGAVDVKGNPARTGTGALKLHHHVKIDKELKADSKIWIEFLEDIRGSGHYHPFIDLNEVLWADQLCFYTDTTKGAVLGFGGSFNDHWLFGKWEPGFIVKEDPSIEFLELYALVISVFAWADELRNLRIILFCDNQAVINMVNSSSSSCGFCMNLIRMLTLKSLKSNMCIFACWVKGAENKKADFLSRQKIDKFKQISNQSVDQYPTPLPEKLWLLSRLWDKFKN